MANKVSNFSDLIHRVAASCLLHPLARAQEIEKNPEKSDDDEEEEPEEKEEEEEEKGNESCCLKGLDENGGVLKRLQGVESLIEEFFEAFSGMKRAYQSLQEAHNPWDPVKIKVADMAVVEELRRIGCLRERYRRGKGLRQGMVADEPCKVAMKELRREVAEKEALVETMREKLRELSVKKGKKGKKGKAQKKFSCREVAAAPTSELFETCMDQVKSASKSFTVLLLSLMRSAKWDIAAAVRSIEGGPAAAKQHEKFAIESYICRKMFHGFENETFYIDGSLSSLIHPEKHRRDCFAQFQDMQSMDPGELLGILPTCHFGKFCAKKFLCIVHPKMEESFFGNLEQRRQVIAENHPRSQFYSAFLRLAKAVWLLHRLAFALEQAPCHFQASKGAEFHPEYMESVVSFDGDEIPAGHIVGFPVTPGFKIDCFVIKSRVYLVSMK